MMRKVNNMVEMGHLDPPYEWYHPEPGEPFRLRVIRWEVGLAERPIADPPGVVIRPSIRFHLAEPFREGGPRYVDFTNRGLSLQVAMLYGRLLQALRLAGAGFDAGRALALIPEGDGELTLELTRYGLGLQTRYQVTLVE